MQKSQGINKHSVCSASSASEKCLLVSSRVSLCENHFLFWYQKYQLYFQSFTVLGFSLSWKSHFPYIHILLYYYYYSHVYYYYYSHIYSMYITIPIYTYTTISYRYRYISMYVEFSMPFFPDFWYSTCFVIHKKEWRREAGRWLQTSF